MLEITASRETLSSYLAIRYLASALVLTSLRSMSRITAGSVWSAFHTCWFMLSMIVIMALIYKNVTNLTHLRQFTAILPNSVIMYLNEISIHFWVL